MPLARLFKNGLPRSASVSPQNLSCSSTVACTPDLSPRSHHEPRLRKTTNTRHLVHAYSRLRKMLVMFFVLLSVVCGLRHIMLTSYSSTDVEDQLGQPLTVDNLKSMFDTAEHYLKSSMWSFQAGTYAPTEAAFSHASRTFSSIAPPGATCQGVAEVSHISMHVSGVPPAVVWDVLLSPAYGPEWNPAIKNLILSERFFASSHDVIPDMFPVAKDSHRGGIKSNRSSDWRVIGQVIEVPIPSAVKRISGGPRFSADWMVTKFDPAVQRGFLISTSAQTDVLAKAAGVELSQAMCLSAILVAPSDSGDTIIHWMQHLNPNVPTFIRPMILAGVTAATQQTINALADKAREVNKAGSMPQQGFN